MKNPREQFLTYLRQQMKHGATAGERVAAQKQYALLMGEALSQPTEQIAGSIPVQPPQPRALTEFDEAARISMQYRHKDDGLGCLLHLLKPHRLDGGEWIDTPTGWHDNVTKADLSFDEVRVIVADRIQELGLDAGKVWAYPNSHCPWQEEQAFRMMSFEQQMEMFR